jgi:hypothetical protein
MAQKGSDNERQGDALVERFQEANTWWLGRFQAEAGLTSEFVSKLSSARSFPDAMNAYQEWGTRRFEMMAEDAKHVLDDTQTFMQASMDIAMSGLASKAADPSRQPRK